MVGSAFRATDVDAIEENYLISYKKQLIAYIIGYAKKSRSPQIR
jgi:hypothetical protein